jgi:hypothetical protein
MGAVCEIVGKIQILIKSQGKKITNRNPVSYLYVAGYNETYTLCRGSSETVSFLRPFFLRAAITPRPLAVAMRSLNPCLFFLFLFDG